MGLPFLTARSQALPGELVIQRMGHSGPWGPVSWQPQKAKRGDQRSHLAPGTFSPRHCGVLGPRLQGAQDFAAGGAVAFEPKLRPPAAVTLAAAPARLPWSPDFPRRRSPGTRRDRGTRGTGARPHSGPARPPTALTSLTLPGADGARRLGRLGRVPPAPCVPGGSGAGRGRVRAGRGTPRLPRPLGDPPVAPPHTADGERRRAEDEPHRYNSQT